MNCVICKYGAMQPGTTTMTLERDDTTLVIKHVPAQICDNCGEAYVDEQTTKQLLQMAEDATRIGIQVEIRDYVAA